MNEKNRGGRDKSRARTWGARVGGSSWTPRWKLERVWKMSSFVRQPRQSVLQFLQEYDNGAGNESATVRARFEKMIREIQDNVCSALEVADGGASFKDDVSSCLARGDWIIMVLQDGVIFEKVSVNVSVVYDLMPPEAYLATKPSIDIGNAKLIPIPFFAAGIIPIRKPSSSANSVSDHRMEFRRRNGQER
nr:oxygen-dependent coproporphyrinogen-III oxidase, chloroplastic [Ipomoea batatas]GME10226.1 oxygen-dependent coproporphyrinogen-III oxidase, chloroplastic [Ipomoea batatas]